MRGVIGMGSKRRRYLFIVRQEKSATEHVHVTALSHSGRGVSCLHYLLALKVRAAHLPIADLQLANGAA
jgi:hypothetical protein